MMHHPNMHHQPMSGHPPQHMGGHQGMPGHHQMPPHQMHRENRHVTLTRVPLGPGGAHGQALGGLGAVPVHHAQRAPHPIRPMHHPQPQHHAVPPVRHSAHQPMKALRRPYVGGAYGPGGAGVLPPYAPPPLQPPAPPAPPPPVVTTASNSTPAPVTTVPSNAKTEKSEPKAEEAAPRDEARAPLTANSKEKTPMCLVNELARYNKIKHQYRLTSEAGPAHKKVFTVTLRLGDTEEYTAEGSSIKRAQHAAAAAALSGTRLSAPPARVSPHSTHNARHAGTVMPTVELNALAMKLCQPAVYSMVSGRARGAVRGLGGPGAPGAAGGAMVYRVRVGVGGRAWLGEGATPQAARHDAAARALRDLRHIAAHAAQASHPLHPAHPAHSAHSAPPAAQEDNDTAGEANGDMLNSEIKSPVSLVHELALKRNMEVVFAVKSERGPPHMRVFVTTCTVGDIETEGEGNGKKVSKRRAAERMVEEIRRRWPPTLLRARPAGDKRRAPPIKKKPRNLIKEGGAGGAGGAEGAEAGGADNPISRLAVARHALRARSPQYVVLEERGAARRREFLVQCCAPPHAATGLGPNKKTAKRRAAHNVLLAMEMSSKTDGATTLNNTAADTTVNTNGDVNKNNNNTTDSKRKEGEAGGASSEVRQPVPGVLLMDYHTRSGHPQQPNGVSETSATGGTGGSSPGAKDQLMYLSQLLGFSVQFSDFPKRNHGEYLSLVSLSTEPPVMCHGGGPSTAHSHEQCARAALRALALMGLDAPRANQTVAGTGTKPSVVSNGIAE